MWFAVGIVATHRFAPRDRLVCTIVSVGHGAGVVVEMPGGPVIVRSITVPVNVAVSGAVSVNSTSNPAGSLVDSMSHRPFRSRNRMYPRVAAAVCTEAGISGGIPRRFAFCSSRARVTRSSIIVRTVFCASPNQVRKASPDW